MSVAVTINSAVAVDPSGGLDSTQNELIVDGLLTLTGNYGVLSPASNGDPLDFTGHDLIKSQQPPRKVEIYQEPTAGVAPVIYCFLYGRGTTQANGKLIVTDFAGVQITLGSAYPAALTSTDVPPNIRFRAFFPSNI